MNISKVLSDAADLLATGKVIAGNLSDGKGGYCAIGAIYKTLGTGSFGDTASREIISSVVEVLSLPLASDRYNYVRDLPLYRLAAWSNNLVDAGKGEEVIAGFRRAAQLLEPTQVQA
jgi:hypothetical protein